jgi:hypothetical protein
VASITDEIGYRPINSSVGPSVPSFEGNVLDVTASRKLTEISLDILLEETLPLNWLVYEVTGNVFTLLSQTTTTQDPVDGLTAFATVSVDLIAGHRYAIGVYYDPPQFTYSWVYTSCDITDISFATPLGDVLVASATVPDSFITGFSPRSCSAHQALTTVAP